MRFFSIPTIFLFACGDPVDTNANTKEGDILLDEDNDGFFSNEDCNDQDALIYNGAEEICDGRDNNCDGQADEGVLNTYYADSDGDGFGNSNIITQACEVPVNFATNGNDCDDTYKEVYPNAVEVCDGLDNDCDEQVDEELGLEFFVDQDNDGYGDSDNVQKSCDLRIGLSSLDGDCDDQNPTISPGSTEFCDEIDNDCDGIIDDNVTNSYYADTDEDGYGDPDTKVETCYAPTGYVDNDTDCNDVDTFIHPNAPEFCDTQDNNCDGVVDENTAVDAITWYADNDMDTFGSATNTTKNCTLPEGYVADNTDCDDADNDIHPSAPELCNGFDDNCDEEIDGDDAIDGSIFFADFDNDGFGNANQPHNSCSQPLFYVVDNTDCNDANENIHPNAVEFCNGINDNCDENTDENTAMDARIFYLDQDDDGFGLEDQTELSCFLPDGYAEDIGDCDDDNQEIYPTQNEYCDDIDNNCNGIVDELATDEVFVFYQDLDEDGFGNLHEQILSCAPVEGYVSNFDDCDDTQDQSNPSLQETCDSIDNDCDGNIDNGVLSIYYSDSDEDGFGWIQEPMEACQKPDGYVTNSTDCDDNQNLAFPNNSEICDNIDNDCNEEIDDDPADGNLYYLDIDEDGFGDNNSSINACSQPDNYVTDNTDCDDKNNLIHPSATEICNNIDDDCQNGIDIDADNMLSFYEDNDGDGFGSDIEILSCFLPSNAALISGDCNDTSILFSPIASEICDGLSNDCDEEIDEEAIDITTWYFDEDEDGFGTTEDSLTDCSQPDGYVTSNEDCDDNNALRYPNADQTCSGIDDNCNGVLDNGENPSGNNDSCAFEGTCLDLLSLGFESGTYTISVGETPVQTYCDQDTDGGGWTLVWKHAYYEVGTPTDHMRFYASTFVQDCPTFGDSNWCNIPQKTTIGQTEMRVQATHNGIIVYDYKGDLNSNLDSNWSGGIMENWSVITDQCSSGNSSARPEPEQGAHAMLGVTWDKANNGDYTSNCDTDRYGQNGSDCRWENCPLPGNISSSVNHVQMTLQMWVR